MSTGYTNIKLNGINYNKNQLQKITEGLTYNSAERNFHLQVLGFIQEWLNDSEFIYANTSGSTGNPKSIRLKKESMINSAELTGRFLNLNSTVRAMLCLPVEYIAGKMMIVRAFVCGYDLALVKPGANPIGESDNKTDFVALIPYQLYHSLESLKRKPAMKIIVGGGEIPFVLEEKIKTLRHDIFATYGMTETCSHVALRKINGKDRTEIYTALEGITFEQDERECLVINAPMLADQKVITNDVVSLMDKTRFKWLGRFDNVINSGGIKIFPETIENKIAGLIEHEYFIGAVADTQLTHRSVLVLRQKRLSEQEKDKIVQKLEKVLSKYEMPKEIHCMAKFVYSPNGKLLRKQTMDKLKG